MLISLVFLATRHYGGDVSALLHMDVRFGERHRVPAGIVLYKDAGYDGMLYYQVARDIPALFSGTETSLDSPYRFQRVLLPLLAYFLTAGKETLLPYALLFINLIAALGALALTFSMTKKKNIHSLTVVANPAVLVGILFSLTEPLSLFFIVLFFHAWRRNDQKLNATAIGALTLSLLARETTVFLIGLLFLWFLFHKYWRDALFVVIPFFLFFVWQAILIFRFGSIAFQANSNIVDFPLSGPLTLLQWSFQDLSVYRLSSLSFLLFFILLCVALGREWREKKKRVGALCFLLSGLCAVMLTLDAHIWGVITSIGRVVPPLYPLYALYAAERDTWVERLLSTLLIAVSVTAALGIALIRHPFTVS